MIDENEKIQALNIINKLFKKYNIQYWLEGGTLIGAVRDNKFLIYDDDIDVSTWYKDRFKILKLKKEFKQHGYDLKWKYHFMLFKNNKHHVCIMSNKVSNNEIFKITFPLFPIIFGFKQFKRADSYCIGNLAYIKMYDDYYPIPEYVESYLSYRFPNWYETIIIKYHENKIKLPQYKKNWKKLSKIAIFPCRMNPPHQGHINTIIKLLDNFDNIIIAILDDKKFLPIELRLWITSELFKKYPQILVIKHDIPFQKRKSFDDLPEFGYIISGNKAVLDNCRTKGYPVQYIKRTSGYASSYIRKLIKDKQCEICGEEKELYNAMKVITKRDNGKAFLIKLPYKKICQQCYFKLLNKKFENMKKKIEMHDD